MPIRCITFDLDDTLWDGASVIARAEDEFYGWLAERFPRVVERHSPEALMKARRVFYRRHPGLAHDLTALRKRWLAYLGGEVQYPRKQVERLVEQGFEYFWTRRNAVEVYEEAHEVLDRLRAGYRVGAITNGNADVHRIGVGHLFDFVVTAAGAGAAKPHPDIFHAALDEAGVAAREAVHVGDDPERDVLGAAEVGMRTVWVNPGWAPWPGGRVPDAVVRSVAGLESVLERWGRVTAP